MDASPPAFETITLSLEGRIGRLTLDQPAKLNALGLDALEEISAACEWFDEAGASVVVISGAGGRAFSSGFDLSPPAPASGDRRARRSNSGELGRRMGEAIEAMTAVAVASIRGHCIGGGVVLASACDMRIVADDTVFRIPEVDLGIPLTWGGVPRLVREIGPAMTRELVMTCRPFDADEALRIGFVNRVVPADDLDSVVDALADTLAAKAPSLLTATKRQVQGCAEEMASTGHSWAGEHLLAAAANDPEATAAARAYLAGLADR